MGDYTVPQLPTCIIMALDRGARPARHVIPSLSPLPPSLIDRADDSLPIYKLQIVGCKSNSALA